ncbi:MAG: cell division/cell wall cluster transcriptional repressor MraZ [Candidatus Woykebacteria bacterium GWB1_45_5]|uniref:Transcriptional regulator MraZ n=2 Tax=Candidatus Woykeibacteriota TaxID=1817899 RepID=A0A1G1W1X1_9BACT|nr:MAG: cell division/cell wall cluster transcriptional repressor MraZ [Candidatus Woykebacteria bacterium GWA1_44_8]OGY23049.1 MAG: cell division/cell wall cluster transcriptional repressor MraZ [Candidatus Woykebacteria bacterium GWB1_45_5]
MFLGEYRHNLDYKGRVAVPKKFREGLVGGAVLTKGLDGCLFLYSKLEWERLTSRLKELPVTQADTRAFERYLFGGATEVEFDSLGRMKIPEYLLMYASLEKEAVLVGILERIEIWGSERWNKLAKRLESKGEEAAEKLAEKGV